MDRRLRVAGFTLLAAILGGCEQATPQEDIQGCANMASEYLDPNWTPQHVTGAYPDKNGGVEAVLAGQGAQVTVNCWVASGYYMHSLGDVALVAGVAPKPGQLYLPMQHRWLTDAELHARLAQMLAPRPGEYAGAAWAPNNPALYDVSDLAKVASTSCFVIQSKLEPARQLVACEEPVGHRYWVSQGGVSQGELIYELPAPPAGLPPIPKAPKPDWDTQPRGKPFDQ